MINFLKLVKKIQNYRGTMQKILFEQKTLNVIHLHLGIILRVKYLTFYAR